MKAIEIECGNENLWKIKGCKNELANGQTINRLGVKLMAEKLAKINGYPTHVEYIYSDGYSSLETYE